MPPKRRTTGSSSATGSSRKSKQPDSMDVEEDVEDAMNPETNVVNMDVVVVEGLMDDTGTPKTAKASAKKKHTKSVNHNNEKNDMDHDNDDDNISVDSAANHSIGSRSSARLKRKREMSNTTNTSNTTTNKVLNFDTVVEEEGEEEEVDEPNDMTTTTTTNVPKSSNTNRHRDAKRTKLNNNHPDDTVISTITTTTIAVEMNDVVMEDKVEGMEHTDVVPAVSTLPHTTTTAIIHPNYQSQPPNDDVHHVTMSSTMLDSTVVAKNIPIQSPPPPPPLSGIVVSQPPPSSSTSSQSLLLSGMANSTIVDAATPAIESLETKVVSVQNQNQSTTNIVVPVVEEEKKKNDHDGNSYASMTGIIERQHYLLRMIFWWIMFTLVQFIAFPNLIPKLSSFSRRTSTNIRRNVNEDETESGDLILNMIQSVQQLEQELKMSMQQEQLTRQSIDLALADHFNDDTDKTRSTSHMNITSMFNYYEIMIQHRITELTKSIQELESIKKGSISPIRQRNNNNTRANNVFLLDLSRSDFFDSMTTSDHTKDTSVHCDDGNHTNEHPPSPQLQRHELDLAVREFQNQIREMIQTTIMTSEHTLEQIREWIYNEVRNATMLYQQQQQSSSKPHDTVGSNNNNDNVVREIINKRIMEKQSDIELYDSNNHPKIDCASIVNGGTILYATPSLVHTLPIMNRILSLLRIRFYGHTAEMMITPKFSTTINRYNNNHHSTLGQCWSFLRAKSAMVIIQLGQSIAVSSVSVEHPFLSSTETAIRTFHVYGHTDISNNEQQQLFQRMIPMSMSSDNATNSSRTKKDDGWYHLGTFDYDISKSIHGTNGLVEFIVTTKSQDATTIPPLRIIRLEIDPIVADSTTTNRNDYNYSCLYRFRVFGDNI